MLTGRFDSENWIMAHLAPLAASQECACLWMVSSDPVPELPKVVPIYPPTWLTRIVGTTSGRLLTFACAAVCKHPDFVGGFHLVVNGILAAIVGRLSGARSIYFCVGGPPEVCDGGVHADNHQFRHMETPDKTVEKRLLKMVSSCDAVVTMGTRAVTFFKDRGVTSEFYVVSGGIDGNRFSLSEDERPFDFILTGRLAPIKRIDVLLEAVANLISVVPEVQGVIIGDGKLREQLEQRSVALGIEENVTFAGRQDNVHDWLNRAKVFVLTSDSEGLSLSMMEAMMSGLPAVVSDVGDLADLVEHGVNGYLVPRRSPDALANRLAELLLDENRRAAFSEAAHRSAMRYERHATIKRWNDILASFRNP